MVGGPDTIAPDTGNSSDGRWLTGTVAMFAIAVFAYTGARILPLIAAGEHAASELRPHEITGFLLDIALIIFAWKRTTDLKQSFAERDAALSRAHDLAYIDEVTGLFNRRYLRERIARMPGERDTVRAVPSRPRSVQARQRPVRPCCRRCGADDRGAAAGRGQPAARQLRASRRRRVRRVLRRLGHRQGRACRRGRSDHRGVAGPGQRKGHHCGDRRFDRHRHMDKELPGFQRAAQARRHRHVRSQAARAQSPRLLRRRHGMRADPAQRARGRHPPRRPGRRIRALFSADPRPGERGRGRVRSAGALAPSRQRHARAQRIHRRRRRHQHDFRPVAHGHGEGPRDLPANGPANTRSRSTYRRCSSPTR